MMILRKKIYGFLGLLGAGFSYGQITYVDAQEGSSGNTFLTGEPLTNTDWIDLTTNSPSANNSMWAKRFGGTPGWSDHNGGDVIQALVAPADTNTVGEITTEITGLADGNYTVWVFFWEQIVSDWEDWMIDSSITSGSLDSYSSSLGPVNNTDSESPVNAATLSFTNAPAVVGAGGNQNMFGVNLGQVMVQNGSSIEVYIDKLLGNGSGNRTIYDGVGYELVGASEKGPVITNLTLVGEDLWEVQLSGQSNTGFVIRESSSLEFDSGAIIEGLSQANPEDAGEVDGVNRDVITTDASGFATVLVTSGLKKNFIRAELAP